MFRDLDLVFFCGKLRDNVVVPWTDEYDPDMTADTLGVTKPFSPGGTSYAYGSSEIKLNTSRIFRPHRENPFELMWSVILHEMW